LTTISIASSSSTQSTAALKRELKVAEARKRTMALLLITPLAIFLLLIFVVPIGTLLTRAVTNPEVVTALPKTVDALANWNRKGPPDNTAYVALAADMTKLAQTSRSRAIAR
jgi:putative spermidine/putrescine transport system permease protein